MPKLSSRHTLLMSLSLVCVAASPAIAQDTPAPVEQQADPAAGAAVDAAPACQPKKKKKKGFGLGGLLKAAQSTGLTNLAGMGGLGKGGALANAAIGTAASLSQTAAANAAAKQETEAC